MTRNRVVHSSRSALVLAGVTAAILTVPLMTPVQLPAFGVEQAQAQGNSDGKGNGRGNSADKRDNRDNRGNGNRGEQRGNSDNAGSANAVGNGPGEKNLHARLGRLNSLQRNVNGLMNSQDPHMDGIRDYVQAGADLEIATSNLSAAQDQLDTARDDYIALADSVGVSGYDDFSPEGLQVELAAVNSALESDPGNAALLAEQQTLTTALETINSSVELQNLYDAIEAQNTAQEEVNLLEGQASDEALMSALVDAANGNRTVDSEMFEWAKSQLEETTGDYVELNQ